MLIITVLIVLAELPVCDPDRCEHRGSNGLGRQRGIVAQSLAGSDLLESYAQAIELLAA